MSYNLTSPDANFFISNNGFSSDKRDSCSGAPQGCKLHFPVQYDYKTAHTSIPRCFEIKDFGISFDI